MFKRKQRRHYYWVYLVPEGDHLELRCPNGGITSWGHDPIEAWDAAYCDACDRFACRPNETLVLVEQRTKIRQQQAELLELDKRRADNKFRIEMLT